MASDYRYMMSNTGGRPVTGLPPEGQFSWLNREPRAPVSFNKPEEEPYNNQGMFGVGLGELAKNRDALRKNPYGHVTGSRQRTPMDDVRRAGMDIGNPATWGWLQNQFQGYRGPHNPQGKQSPWNMNKYYDHVNLGVMTPRVIADMTGPERHRYAQKRFTYDNKIQSGLSDETTYERQRRTGELAGAKPTGNYDKYGNPV